MNAATGAGGAAPGVDRDGRLTAPLHRSAEVRRALAGPELLRVAGVHDAISARLAEHHQFGALWASGLGISAVHGVPDASILTMTEFLGAAITMSQATRLPVIADCDTGFGEVGNVVRLVRLYEQAGIAGVCIEDKQYPKRNSLLEGHQLADPHEFAAKVEAAKRAQRSDDFVVIARLESLIAGAGLADALARARLYASAGADVILVHSKAPTAEEVLAFACAWRKLDAGLPLAVVPTTYSHVGAAELREAGINMAIYANQALRAAISAIDRALAAIAASGTGLSQDVGLAGLDEVFDLIGTGALEEVERWYRDRVQAIRAAQEHPPSVGPGAAVHGTLGAH